MTAKLDFYFLAHNWHSLTWTFIPILACLHFSRVKSPFETDGQTDGWTWVDVTCFIFD